MKLFLYNDKDQCVIDELELGTLSNRDIDLIVKVANFLESQGVLNFYKKLAIGRTCHWKCLYN